MTELLCLTDSFLKEFFAKITAINENKVALDRTAFYPQGGGQPSDTGKLFFGEKEFEVLEVKKDGGEVWHKLSFAQGLEIGAEVKGKIDWQKRYALMRMHTSAHVLAAIIFKKTGKLITGNQIGFLVSRMDFNAGQSFNGESAKELEKEVNAELSKNHEVSVSFLAREKALKKPELVRLKDLMPPSLKEWRLVKIGDIDLQADGGTHVKNTSEIGSIKITKTQNKGTENKRIYWELRK